MCIIYAHIFNSITLNLSMFVQIARKNDQSPKPL